jgi:hypothetical protein
MVPPRLLKRPASRLSRRFPDEILHADDHVFSQTEDLRNLVSAPRIASCYLSHYTIVSEQNQE